MLSDFGPDLDSSAMGKAKDRMLQAVLIPMRFDPLRPVPIVERNEKPMLVNNVTAVRQDRLAHGAP
jgi:hypothetical protein